MTKINHRIVALAIASMFVAAPSFAKDKRDMQYCMWHTYAAI